MSKYIINDNKKHKKLITLVGVGEENARSMRYLAQLCGVDERTFRKMIEVARRDGVIIASSDAGYYVPSCEDELIEYYRRTMHGVNTTLDTLRPVKDIIDEVIVGMVAREALSDEDE